MFPLIPIYPNPRNNKTIFKNDVRQREHLERLIHQKKSNSTRNKMQDIENIVRLICLSVCILSTLVWCCCCCCCGFATKCTQLCGWRGNTNHFCFIIYHNGKVTPKQNTLFFFFWNTDLIWQNPSDEHKWEMSRKPKKIH